MRWWLAVTTCSLVLLLTGCGFLDTLVGTSPPPPIDPATYQVVQPADFVANPDAYIKKPIVLSGPIVSSKQIDRNVWQIQAQLAADQMNAYTSQDLTADQKWLRVYFTLDSVDPRRQVQGGYHNVWVGNEALFVGRPDRLDLLPGDPSSPQP